MLKFLKVFLALMVTVILALIAIPFFVDVNDYKPEIRQAVYDATGRNLNIGNIKLSLFPWVGFTLTDISLDNAKGFSPAHMLEVESIDIKVALIPLLDQQVEVKRFDLERPKLWLSQNDNGSNNWSDLQSQHTSEIQSAHASTSKANQQASQASAMPTVAFEAKLLQLLNGQVFWEDSKGKLTLQNVDLKITDLQLQQPIGINLSAELAGNPVHITGQVGPILDLAKLDVNALPALIRIQSDNFALAPLAAWLPELTDEQEQQIGKLDDIKISLDISAEQHADKLLLSTGSIDIQAKNSIHAAWKLNVAALNTLKLESLAMAMDGKDVLSLSGKVRHLQKHPKFEAKLITSQLQRIWLNQFSPRLENIYKNHPKPWQSIKIEAFLAGDTDIIEIRNMQLKLDNEPLQVSGDIALGAAPDIQLRMTANELHLDPWLPQSQKQKAAPNLASKNIPNTSQETEPNLTFLKPWYLSARLQAKSLYVKRLKLENLHMTLSSEKGVIRLNPLSFNINGGHIQDALTLYANQYPTTWKESVNIRGVSIQPILKALADFDQLSGITTLNAEITGKGLLPKHIIHSMKGRGDFLFEDGQFKGVDIAKTIRKLKKQPTTTQQSDFAQMQGTFHIKDATITNHDLYMASPLFRLTGKGIIYLDPLKIDYHVRPRLVKTLAGQGGSIRQKGVVVPLHIYGPFEHIQTDVVMDKAALLDSAAAINNATGHKINGVGGKVLDQGFVKTRDEEVAKAKQKAKAKLEAEKERARQKAAQKAKDKLKDLLKGFKF